MAPDGSRHSSRAAAWKHFAPAGSDGVGQLGIAEAAVAVAMPMASHGEVAAEMVLPEAVAELASSPVDAPIITIATSAADAAPAEALPNEILQPGHAPV